MPIASHIFGSSFGITCRKADISSLVAFTLASDYFRIADYLSRIVGNPLLSMNAKIQVAVCMGYRRYVATEQHPCTLRRVLLA